jgi:hypothetical protein
VKVEERFARWLGELAITLDASTDVVARRDTVLGLPEDGTGNEQITGSRSATATFRGQIKETYSYRGDGQLTGVAIARQAGTADGSTTISGATDSADAPAMGTSVQRATTFYELMGRATDYKEFAADGTTQTYRRQATYDRTGLVTDDSVGFR